MNRQDFINKYENERPMYEAWSSFVLNEIKNKIYSGLSNKSAYDELIKVPPTSRVKNIDSLVAKAYIRKKDKYKDPYNEITDKAGVRFIALLTLQLEMLCDIVEKSEHWTFSKDKELDEWRSSDPRLFDYQSVHYVVYAKKDIKNNGVLIKKDTPCEVQLRTLLQHAYAELAHDTIYKGDVSASPNVHRAFAKSMALMETTDDLLCQAKQLLEEATLDIKEWSDAIEDASKYIKDKESLISDKKTEEYLISSMGGFLKRTSAKDFLLFLSDPNHSYIGDRVDARKLDYVEFRHPFILLVYFLAKRFRQTLHRKWPLSLEVLEIIYSDLGLVPSWASS